MRVKLTHGMSNQPEPRDERPAAASTERDELRTMAFRMREIQRLLSMRVEQENRRLEAEGIEPVDDREFRESSHVE